MIKLRDAEIADLRLMLEKLSLEGSMDGRGPRGGALRTGERSQNTPLRHGYPDTSDLGRDAATSKSLLRDHRPRLGSEEITEVDERLERTGNFAAAYKDAATVDVLPKIDR